ncbi:MAG: LysR family transcriptional regulator [Burkholderiales bacterium]|nr:LysR family transcriptional regulator [Burkholderiales bacterium]
MDIDRLDLNLLRVFEAVLRTGRVTEAADALDMSQPALSFALGKLRRHFDDPLFVRTAAGMQPTPLAQAMAAPVREALDLLRTRLAKKPVFDPARAARTFTISLSDAGEMVLLPRLLRRLRREAPGVDIASIQLPPAELEAAMEQGAVDLAVGYFPDLVREVYYQQRLFSQPFVCIMNARRALPGGRLTMKAFLAASHAVVRPQGRSQEVFERKLEELGLERRVALSIPHFMSVPFVVMESDLIATVPEAVAESFARMAGLRVAPLPLPLARVDLKQHWHARYHRDPANQWLRATFAEEFGSPPEAPGLARPRRAR